MINTMDGNKSYQFKVFLWNKMAPKSNFTKVKDKIEIVRKENKKILKLLETEEKKSLRTVESQTDPVRVLPNKKKEFEIKIKQNMNEKESMATKIVIARIKSIQKSGRAKNEILTRIKFLINFINTEMKS